MVKSENNFNKFSLMAFILFCDRLFKVGGIHLVTLQNLTIFLQ